ncbi:MAG: hypothetical protein JNL90_10130 [Planctomycetes bacterium]|nr:hypothetical protein [Planctomycetota bacterium]
MALEHRVLIYVFRRRASGVEYLFERRWPHEEFAWSPIPAEVGYTESLEVATRRSMQHDWHAPPPDRLVDLKVCAHESVGDLDLIDWGMGYAVRPQWEPSDAPVRAELAWRPLPVALELLEGEAARRALFRLHLQAAE